MRRKPYSVGLLISSAVCRDLCEPTPIIWQLLLVATILTTTARLMGAIIANRRGIMMVYLVVAYKG